MSTSTRIQIRNRVRAKLDTATTGGTWGDELNDYIYQAEVQVASDLPDCALDDRLVSNTDHTAFSSTPSDYIGQITRNSAALRVISLRHYCASATKYKAVLILPSLTNLRAKIETANDNTSGRGTTYAAIVGNRLFVGPVAISDIIREDYLRIPDLMDSDDDTSDIPEHLLYLVELKAVALALLQTGNQGWQQWESLYDNSIVKLYQRYNLDPPRAFINEPAKR